jgi:RuvA, C-terminal domain
MRSTSTATGISLSTLASKLQKLNPSLSLAEAKTAAKELLPDKGSKKKKDIEKRGFGRRVQENILNRLFGTTVGGFLSNKITAVTSSKVEEKLSEPGIDLEKKQKIPLTEVQVIMKKLDNIETLVKSIKAIKVEKPKEVSDEAPKNVHHEDALAGLMSLGYKKNEATEMLKNASGSSASELVKEALKSKNKEAIPSTQVPVVAQAAKESLTPATSPQTDAAQSTAVLERKDKEEKDAMKQDAQDKKKIISELDDILSKVKQYNLSKLLSGIAGLLGGLFTGLLKNIGLALLAGLKKVFMPIWEAIKKVMTRIAKWLPGGEAIAEAIEAGLGLAEVGLVTVGAFKMASGEEAMKIKKGTDERLEKYGIKLLSNKQGMTEGYDIGGKKYAIEGQTQPKNGMNLYDEMPKKDQDIITAFGREEKSKSKR